MGKEILVKAQGGPNMCKMILICILKMRGEETSLCFMKYDDR